MSNETDRQQTKRRVHHFAKLKEQGQKIVVVTAYDYPTAIAAEKGGVDAVLVGDSLGMVALGMDSTLTVTLDMMVHHTSAVRRGIKHPFLIADMPFLSYGVSLDKTVENAGRLVRDAGAEAVKIEGGVPMAETIRALTNLGIPVMAHIGLVPQSIHQLGGYRVQGRDKDSAARLMDDALAVQEAGAFSVVLEALNADIVSEITGKLTIPTIGIGAGRNCDGQVLVMSDVVGMLPGAVPKFVQKYDNLGDAMARAVSDFSDDVRKGIFPEEKHEY